MNTFPGLRPLTSLRVYALIAGMLLSSLSAKAHPLPLSYVDLRLRQDGIEATITVRAADLAHDLPRLTEANLLTPNRLRDGRQEVFSLVGDRLKLVASGKNLAPVFEDIVPVPDQTDVRLRLHYAWHEMPAKLQIQCHMFPYDQTHQTYADVYEGQALRRELIFDSQTPELEYILGSHQSVGSVVLQFVIQGVYHIFTGPDHVLFIVGLLLLGGTLKQLLKIVTAFTVAHSVTLCLATLGVLSPPARFIEPTIALSIIFVGIHGMVMRRRGSGDGRMWIAFLFGFIHGFGFANALQELALPRESLVAALFSFNLGVEFGQACIVLTVAPLLAWIQSKNERFAKRMVTVGSVVVILAGAFWFVERVWFVG